MARMQGRRFNDLITAQWGKGLFLCVGLDPDLDKIAVGKGSAGVRILDFNRSIIDATRHVAGSYKPNSAFYERYGAEGWTALSETISYIRESAPDVPVILDAKRGDIGNTNEYYARAIFDELGADAVTVHPFTGAEGIEAFLERTDKGIFVYCRSSNPGAKEFQDLTVGGEPLYLRIAGNVSASWNTRGNCGLIVGATYPEELAAVRKIAPDIPILIPGIGAQGGDLERTIAAGKSSAGGIIVSVSRAILYASTGADFAGAAQRAAEEFDAKIRSALR